MNFLFFKSQPRFPHVDKNRLYLVSSSGGATWANGFEFYTQFKMPFKHILMAGGDVPRENSDFNFSENDKHPDGLKDDPKMTIKKEEIPASAFNAVKYYYLIGTADELLPTVNEAMKLYQELGFKTDIELLNGVRHADFTYPDKIISMYNKIQRMENLPPPSF
jgi:hypothetical protein